MKKIMFVILLCSLFSLIAFAQEDKEIVKIDKAYASKKIIVRNYYYPKPGKFDEVLALRIAASQLLKEFGLSAGRVLVTRQTMNKANGKQEEIAAVTYLSEYENLAALEKELSSFTVEQNNRFQKEILNKMKPLIDRFKRTSSYVVYE